ncbi:ABC-type transport auxiliary lipoprotein family protein [Sphingomonas sp.]|uniref:ABC-type transport auxiliary lipoprotein family protein n=1 Tax=Sphingomonas sp. TaxID=28214 RepID=UPI001EC6E834|nr:ABC-type transport auxiliary lipoprotein family protein [Sphingomonas sp.]MBX3593388.1 membrane integrity-associated transporter subunit PqiC [Sphingomonas sp.]
MKKLLILALLPLGGCISFGSEPPPSLLTISSTAQVAVGETRRSDSARSITVTAPVVSQELAVTRVPVRSGDTSIAYLKDAQWVEPPARLFARLLSDTVSTRTGRIVLTLRQSISDPGARLGGELRFFGVDAARREAVVTYDATLIRERAKGAEAGFEKRRFEARVPLAAIEPAAAGTAINTAANQVADEVADWVGR